MSTEQNFAQDIFATKRGGVDVRGAVWQIPHDQKKAKGGEDTYILTSDVRFFGVFDGVGGWAESGVDPRLYALALAKSCAEEAAVNQAETDPVNWLSAAYDRVRALRVIGSCTATVAILDDAGMLRVAHLGDSGLLVVRNGSTVLRTVEQQHVFNMPFQLGTESRDRPQDSRIYEIQLQRGDLVLLGSDGLLDNVDDARILETLKQNARAQPQTQARAVAQVAYDISKDRRAITPFARNALAQLGERWIGGKEDDITSLVVHYGRDYASL
jgi:protein phosphatase PTC7